MSKNIGIWLDLENAKIIEGESINVVASDLDHFNLKGGSRANTPYGAQDATSESKHLERKKHQLKDYFQNIISELSDFERIVLFGPAETKTDFSKFLEEKKEIAEKVAGVETADSMTDNQLKEWVRNYFS